MRLKFKWIYTLMLAFLVQFSFAQEKTITGVVSESGMPLPGATVVVKGTSKGVPTDFDGKYSISAKTGDVLEFSYVGMKTKTVTVGASSTVNVTLDADNTLEEVVVTSYTTRGQNVTTSAVSKVSAEDIESLVPSTSLDNMLQGKAAGVSVTASNGRPGGNAFVRIRGQASLSAGANAPLYVLDGTIVTEAQINAIPPSEIEDITILKDAATTAMYGSRGSAGVVIYKTKQGQRNRAAVVTLKSRYGFTEEIPWNFELMNIDQKFRHEKELGNLGIAAAVPLPGFSGTPEQQAFLRQFGVQNWDDLISRQGVVAGTSLGISGGGEKFDYSFGASHDRDNGTLNHIFGFERMNVRGSVNYSANKWLDTGFNISHTRNFNDGTRDRNNVQNPFRARFDTLPYETLYELDANGNPIIDANGNPAWNWTRRSLNPIEYLKTNLESNINNLTIGGFNAKVKFTDKLSYSFRAGVTSGNNIRETYALPRNRLDQLIGDPAFPGLKTDSSARRIDYTLTNLVNYNHSSDIHSFSLTAMQEYNSVEDNFMSISSSGFANANLTTVSNAGRIDSATTTRSRLNLISYGFFANYDYKQRYVIDFSARADGSSNFGVNTRWAYFWTASGAWNIAKEDFFKIKDISTLKLRGSYGTTGNRNFGRYSHIPTVAFTAGIAGGQATTINNPGNPDLQWETQIQKNLGLEFGLFNSRVRGAVDVYERGSDNLLFSRPGSFEDGRFGLPGNVGSIRNRGLEVELSTDIIRNANFRWTFGGNVALMKNTILSLPPVESGVNDIQPSNTFFANWREGGMINEFYLNRWHGVDPATGRPQYLDINGNVVFFQELTGDNRVMTGKSPLPTYEGGIYTTFNYKGFGMRADVFFRGGNYIYNVVKSNLINDGRAPNANQTVDAFNYWKQPGDTGVLPNPIYFQETNISSDRWLEKGDFMRLRNVELSYTFQQNILKKLPFSNLRFYVQAQNLFTLTDFYGDPEVGISSGESISFGNTIAPGEATLYSYPNRRMFTFGIDVSF